MFKKTMNMKMLLAVSFGLMLGVAILFAFSNETLIAFAGPGWSADSYGNTLLFVEVWQWNTTHWVLRGNLTEEGTVRIHHAQEVNFTLMVKLNTTLVPEVSGEYVNVYMNISTVWTDKQLNYTGHSESGGFYWIKYEGVWNTGLPAEGVTYNCIVDYRQYY